MSWKRKRDDQVRPRNPYVVPSRQKKSGPMTSPTSPKGGSHNWRNLVEDEEDDEPIVNDGCDD
jgi:hypothetical protein